MSFSVFRQLSNEVLFVIIWAIVRLLLISTDVSCNLDGREKKDLGRLFVKNMCITIRA